MLSFHMLTWLFNIVEAPVGIFGVPLNVSIKYANVAISLTNEQGESYVYGYVPIVIAKCGVFLKEKGKDCDAAIESEYLLTLYLATDVEGIFRLSGSAKRIKELQHIFDSPDRYGKGLDWTGYTVHDAANILRRYLTHLPQPIVPLEFYERFRDPLRSHQAQAVGDMEAQAQDTGNFDHNAVIITYQRLITELPALNRQLLLYILDLLAVFASKSEQNRMTSPNLAAIFQPGMLSHPEHDMLPKMYRLSQDVIIFLIENQDSFLVGMSGTAADEKTVKEVQSGVQRQPNIPTRATQAALGRSASNASAGADSLRKQGGIRRNVSVSSKNSRASSNHPSPGSPAPGSPLTTTASGGGVYRSNTLPSKKSPGIPSSSRFRNADPSPPPSSNLSPSGPTSAPRTSSPGSKLAQSSPEAISPSSAAREVTLTPENPSGLNSLPESKESSLRNASREQAPPSSERLSLRPPEQGNTTIVTSGSSGTPSKERKTLFSRSPTSDNERKDATQRNKLRKKRIPDVCPNASAQSSTNSLHVAPDSPSTQNFYTPMPTPGVNTLLANDQLISSVPPTTFNTGATPSSEQAPRIGEIDKLSSFHISQPNSTPGNSPALKPSKSPGGSVHSKMSATEESELDQTDNGVAKEVKKRRHRWTLPASTKIKNENAPVTPGRLGSNAVAEKSTGSIASEGKPRKSMTTDSHQTQRTGTEAFTSSGFLQSNNESTLPKEKDGGSEDKEKRGPIGWFKGKVAKAKEDRKEREAEKERAKSPPRTSNEHTRSKQNFSAIAQEGLPTRGRSTDVIAEAPKEEEGEQVTTETAPAQQ